MAESMAPLFVPPPLSEFDLIENLFAPFAAKGGLSLRDDAAVFLPLPGCEIVLTVDACVSGVHFFPDDPPEAIAKKALRTNLSDLAAKGAQPDGFLLTLGRAAWQNDAWFTAFAQGLAEDANHYHCALYGGDTVRASAPVQAYDNKPDHNKETAPRGEQGFFLSITAFGHVPAGKMVKRHGGQPGDHLYLSGTIGDAALGLRIRLEPEAEWVQALSAEDKSYLLDRYLLPQPRTALAQALQDYASAAMDISDGLVGDCAKLTQNLGRTLALSSVPLSKAARSALIFQPALFETALTGGDDYEILAAIPPQNTAQFESAAIKAGIPVAFCGTLTTAGEPALWLDDKGVSKLFTHASYTHF